MGYRMRLEEDLERNGIPAEKITAYADALSILESAGDSFSDALYTKDSFLEQHDTLVQNVEVVLAALTAAVAMLKDKPQVTPLPTTRAGYIET